MSNIYFQLFISFFKIGAFTFGGGWAMISLIEREVVDHRRWLTQQEFLDQLAMAQSLPGVLAVNISVAVGYKLRGVRGGVAAAIGSALPSFLIILTIAIFLSPSMIKDNPTLAAIFKGIRPAVVALIVSPVINATRSAGITLSTAIFPVAVALLVASKLPWISNPILFIVIAAVAGWLLQRRDSRKEGLAR